MSELSLEKETENLLREAVWRALRGEATEPDICFLLGYFEPSRRPVKPRRTRLGLTKRIKVKSDDSLAVLAQHFEKDVKTIRRWCKTGRVSGAYQTKGRHWRVRLTPETVPSIWQAFGATMREPKSHLQSRRWKRLLKRLRVSYLTVPFLLPKLDREFQSMKTSSAENGMAKLVSEETFSRFWDAVERGAEKGAKKALLAVEFYDLLIAARELSGLGKTVNAASLAKLLGISRRTLFRHFRGSIRDVISHAHQSLGIVSDQKRVDDSDHDFISQQTSETKADKFAQIQSPSIHYRKEERR